MRVFTFCRNLVESHLVRINNGIDGLRTIPEIKGPTFSVETCTLTTRFMRDS